MSNYKATTDTKNIKCYHTRPKREAAEQDNNTAAVAFKYTPEAILTHYKQLAQLHDASPLTPRSCSPSSIFRTFFRIPSTQIENIRPKPNSFKAVQRR
jgi:hypothetical protein